MKLSNPTAIKWAALAASGVLRAWMGLLDVRMGYDDPQASPAMPGQRRIYLCWHENILFGAWAYCRFGVASLISRHRDGELIAQVARMLRGSTVRGSTDRGRNKGGSAALREMIQRARQTHLAITPDGPKGPRRVVQGGAVYLASRAQMPLVPAGIAFHNPWRAGSWDRLALPQPFRRAVCLFGEPMEVPRKLDREGLERYQAIVQDAMDAIQARAQRAADGKPDARDRRLTSPRTALCWPRELTGD